MKTRLVGLQAETPLHVGIGKVNAAIDLPIAREVATHFPHVPGSGAKGALRVWATEAGIANVPRLFGTASGEDTGDDGGAGTILCGEMRLALLPVRTLYGSFKYVTCPMIIDRLCRDFERSASFAKELPDLRAFLAKLPRASEKPRGCWKQEALLLAGADSSLLSLEEREFAVIADLASETKERLRVLLSVFERLCPGVTSSGQDIAMVSNDDFAWFCQYGLPVVTRNRLEEDGSKRVKDGMLWTEEQVPTDTVMWMSLGARTLGKAGGANRPDDLQTLLEGVVSQPYLQVGGNETIGQGWLKMAIPEEGTPA